MAEGVVAVVEYCHGEGLHLVWGWILLSICHKLAAEPKIELAQGVFGGVLGPHIDWTLQPSAEEKLLCTSKPSSAWSCVPGARFARMWAVGRIQDEVEVVRKLEGHVVVSLLVKLEDVPAQDGSSDVVNRDRAFSGVGHASNAVHVHDQ
eukprot:6568341-Ditylum_brightwellii.AAC.1